MRGSQFISPKNFFANFLAQALFGVQSPLRRNRPSFLPRKALRNPRKSPQAIQWVQSLHRTTKRPQIGPFQLSAPFGHLRLAPKLAPIPPKIPRFSTFSCTRKVFCRGFPRPNSRFCKIGLHRERFWQKYGANFKRGQRPFRLLGRGGVVCFVSSFPAAFRGPAFPALAGGGPSFPAIFSRGYF